MANPTSSNTPYLIAGNLPFDNTGAGLLNSLTADNGPEALAAHYAQAYRAALDSNQNNYNNIIHGFQQTAGAQFGNQQQTLHGYRQLLSSILDSIKNVGTQQRQDLGSLYDRARAADVQRQIDSGLYNSSATTQSQRGITLDEARARNKLAEDLGQMKAGYQQQIGDAAQQYRNAAIQQNANLALQQLGFMNSVTAPYPDAGLYANIANMLGQAKQASADRRTAMGLGAMNMGAAGGGLPSISSPRPIGGYAPNFDVGGGYAGGDPYGGYNMFAQPMSSAAMNPWVARYGPQRQMSPAAYSQLSNMMTAATQGGMLGMNAMNAVNGFFSGTPNVAFSKDVNQEISNAGTAAMGGAGGYSFGSNPYGTGPMGVNGGWGNWWGGGNSGGTPQPLPMSLSELGNTYRNFQSGLGALSGAFPFLGGAASAMGAAGDFYGNLGSSLNTLGSLGGALGGPLGMMFGALGAIGGGEE